MNPRFITPVVILLLTVITSLAQVRVIEASYGVPGKNRDVTDRVRRLVDRGRLSFTVNNENLGGDPVKGKVKRLDVTYIARGETRRTSAREDDTFRFETKGGGGGGRPNYDPYAPWNYSHRPPPQSDSEVVFINGTGRDVNVYNLDQYGGWYWAANIGAGRRVSFNSRAGQQWLVADRAGRVVSRVAARRGEAVVRLGY